MEPAEWRELLAHGELEVLGRMPWSSNATFLVNVEASGVETRGIYKPGRGERPLWDFPEAIYRREVAAYEFSEALGLGVVPETIVRDDGDLRRRLASALHRCGFRGAVLHAARRSCERRDASRHRCIRRCCQQCRPKGRASPERWRRPHLGNRPRPLLPSREQAPNRDVGLRRRADPDDACGTSGVRARSSDDEVPDGRRARFPLPDPDECQALPTPSAAIDCRDRDPTSRPSSSPVPLPRPVRRSPAPLPAVAWASSV